MDITRHSLPGRPQDGLGELTLMFQRYKPYAAPADTRSSVVLVFSHSVASHKETWEPIAEYLFEFQGATTSEGVHIAEVWSMDSPNHGEAAAVNEEALLDRPRGFSAYECGRGIQTLLNSGLVVPDTKIVSIGHSAGACIMICCTTEYSLDRLPFASMILIEPTMMTEEAFVQWLAKRRPTQDIGKGGRSSREAAPYLPKQTEMRTDSWASRAAAHTWLRARRPWKRWDPSSLALFVKYGLRDLPTATYPTSTEGVTLACTRVQETAGYMYERDGVDATARLADLCARIPVHCIFGAENDFVKVETQHDLCDAARGRRMTSVSKIAGAGHLVTQEKPYELARAIWTALIHDYALHKNLVSKL
ncbi:alpha/beta-hydrolase [Mycena vitilis]|nr:alpha/beta-hydrolase [Mycena vitilis]